MTKEYSLAAVLSVITGRMLVIEGFSVIHELIEWLRGCAVFTHEIPVVADEVMANLKRQFPQLNTDQNLILDGRINFLVQMLKTGKHARAALVLEELKIEYGNSFQVEGGER